MSDEKEVNVRIRFEPDLHRRIKEAAARRGHSLNQTVNDLAAFALEARMKLWMVAFDDSIYHGWHETSAEAAREAARQWWPDGGKDEDVETIKTHGKTRDLSYVVGKRPVV